MQVPVFKLVNQLILFLVYAQQANEALSVHGNVQLTGQVLQPSDLRVKERIREVQLLA